MKRAASQRVALFGGSFNPPHIGHTAFCKALVNEQDIDRVWVLPSDRHPFGKEMAPFELRMQMCRIAFASLSPKVEIRDDERTFGVSGYTVDLLEKLTTEYPDHIFVLALGADNYAVREEWKDFDRIEQLADVRFYGRRGWDQANESLDVESPFPKVSSTKIRKKIKAGTVPEELLPEGIAGFIQTHHLYRSSSSC